MLCATLAMVLSCATPPAPKPTPVEEATQTWHRYLRALEQGDKAELAAVLSAEAYALEFSPVADWVTGEDETRRNDARHLSSGTPQWETPLDEWVYMRLTFERSLITLEVHFYKTSKGWIIKSIRGYQ